jgi:predicted nucleic acid-binding protein
MKVLVDTNVLLDVIQERQPFEEFALRIWKLVEEKQLQGCVSGISFNNIFYVARKQVGTEGAMEALRGVRQTFEFVSIDAYVIDRALASKPGDFEDAIQAAAAVAAQADLIVTRNKRDFGRYGVTVLTPEETLALLEP